VTTASAATAEPAQAHAVAPRFETWNATADLQQAAGPFSPHDVVTGAEHPAADFSFVGVRWSPDGMTPGAQMQVRTRSTAGTWSGWTTAGPADTQADPGSADAATATAAHGSKVSSDPIYAGASDAVQTRVVSTTGAAVTPPASVEVITLDPGKSAADASAGAFAARTTPTQPGILTRADWSADESLRTLNPGCGTPQYSDIVFAAVIHHTEGTNDYGPADVPAILRGIYDFHVVAEGYCDIAYNFLVDKFGQIWEGRYGGIANPVLGAHAGGFNARTTGVAILGDYTYQPASPASIDALENLLAWKLGQNWDNPVGTAVLTSAGGEFTDYPEGVPVLVNVISGHRDVDATSCPGEALYDQLPEIRSGTLDRLGEGLFDVRVDAAAGSGGIPVALTAGSTRTASWATAISDQAGRELQVFTGTVGAGGRFGITWDGRTSSGEAVPNGLYFVKFLAASTATDGALTRTLPFRVSFRPGDLLVATVPTTSGGPLSVRTASQRTGYAVASQQIASALSVGDPKDWTFEFHPFHGDQEPDLYAIHERNTGSGHVEVHVLAAADNYQTFLGHFATALAGVPIGEWQFAIGSSDFDAGDLYAIHERNTDSRMVEVHTLTQGSNYVSFNGHRATASPPVVDADCSLLVSSRGDLVAVVRRGSASNEVEVHALSRASGYQRYTVHSATPLPVDASGVFQFALGDFDRDGVADLVVIRPTGGSSGNVELHALAGGTDYHGWIAHAATGLPAVNIARTWSAIFS